MKIKELKNLLTHPKTLLTHPKVVSAYVDTSLVLLNKFTGYVSKFMRHLLVVQNIDPNTIPRKKHEELEDCFANTAGSAPKDHKTKTITTSSSYFYPKNNHDHIDVAYKQPFAKWDYRTRTWISCSDPTVVSTNHYDLMKRKHNDVKNLFKDIEVLEVANCPEIVESLMVAKKKPVKKKAVKKKPKTLSKKAAKRSSKGKK